MFDDKYEVKNMISIAVIMTVFNRKEKTKTCIDFLISEIFETQCSMDFYITNDGCTDGTHDLLESYNKFPNVHIVELQGTGNLFWNKGMHEQG